eukprot:1085751-Alexandrium_andersonii.AAC.1
MRGQGSRKPWSLMLYGNVWQRVEGVVRARGHSTAKVTWVPGHTTSEAVEQGTISAADRVGNDAAHNMACR